MGGEHVTPPASSLDAMLAIAALDGTTVHHVRRCPRCRIIWYRAGAFRAGCTDPRMGIVVLESIGQPPPDTARAHIEQCLACRLLVLDAARALDPGAIT